MKPLFILALAAGILSTHAESAQSLQQSYAVEPGGRLVMDVAYGNIEIRTNDTSFVVVDVARHVSMRKPAEEERFFRDNPVVISKEGNTITIRSSPARFTKAWWGKPQRAEDSYKITVPSRFQAKLKTQGGGITVLDLAGPLHARTSGGSLNFTRIHGPVDGQTSGGSIRLTNCEGDQSVGTSGGDIHVAGGSGNVVGRTSGGSVHVSNFQGPAEVSTSGGGIDVLNISGPVHASTSGGSISATLLAPLPGEVTLSTSGGSIHVKAPSNAAFQLDAATSGGGVRCELPLANHAGKNKNALHGPVSGGGKTVHLRTSGGGIRVISEPGNLIEKPIYIQ